MKLRRRQSGLFVPETEDDQDATRREERRIYDLAHRRCPQCLGVNLETTLAPMILSNRDTNRATCAECKWRGIVDDLRA